ncbi:MAG: DUF5117 domain-containing protein [Planctomycetes bacterium]|nr:DUF5117 domain-containing protein [Planctomycetota bacterium]
MNRNCIALCFWGAISLPLLVAQTPPGRPGRPTGTAPPAGAVAPKPPAAGEPKKYDDVVTKDFTTQAGVFAVHRFEEKVLFEIPQEKLGKLFMWRAEVAKGPGGSSWGGASLGEEVLRFERRGNKIYLWKSQFSKRSDGKAIQSSIDASNTGSILAVFPVEAEGKDRSAVIAMGDVFINGLSDLPISAAAGTPGASADASRSYLSDVKAFPTNINVNATITFRVGAGSPGAKSVTSLVHHTLVQLPEVPMMGRNFDPRVGYFTESFVDFAHPLGWSQTKQFIARYRLEKKDPAAEVSEVVKPITYYLSKEIPEKWRPFMKKGVEDWAIAFEKAGYKNAIVCKDAPTPAEDPHFDPEDARYSVIRWVAEPVANAMGPHVHDPRSGEIISAHIIFWHDVVKLAQMWYFIQCSAQDPRARKLPMPDELTGELLRYICAHEVGHTIGLRHNHRASQAYSIAQLRDPKFTAQYGSVGSIMSYGRYNYVTQPEDKMPVKDLIPKLAPYDFFAIEWGYKAIPAAKTPDAEKETLDTWASRQIKEPFLRFGGEDGPSAVDPTVLTENIGNDPVEATALGLKNVDKVMDHLIEATTTKGEDFALLEETYKEIVSARGKWLAAVAKQVGGVVENRSLGGRGNDVFVRVPEDKQRAAVKFLLDNAFTTPVKLVNPALVNMFKYIGPANEIALQQRSLLNSLLSPSLMGRLFDAELQAAEKAYTATELVDDLQNGIFAELKAESPRVEPLRRQLQRNYVEILEREFAAPAEPAAAPPVGPPSRRGSSFAPPARTSELRAVARVALENLFKDIATAAAKSKDPATISHLKDLAAEISQTLTGKKN